MKARLYVLFFTMVFIISCETKQNTNDINKNVNDLLLTSVLWYQHSSEMSALYYQGFNIAKFRLDEALKSNIQSRPLAVVVDIDETMLNNSPYETQLINKPDSLKNWYEWTAKACAKALPGALDFAKYADSKNVQLFYITNRDDNERIPTIKNLQFVGFPFAQDDHLYTRSDLNYNFGNTSSKEERRNKVAENYEIVLFIGDNLNDFSKIFEDRSQHDGKEAVEKNKELFGQKFIVMPNPMYGAWEKPLYNYKNKITGEDKIKLLKTKLSED